MNHIAPLALHDAEVGELHRASRVENQNAPFASNDADVEQHFRTLQVENLVCSPRTAQG